MNKSCSYWIRVTHSGRGRGVTPCGWDRGDVGIAPYGGKGGGVVPNGGEGRGITPCGWDRGDVGIAPYGGKGGGVVPNGGGGRGVTPCGWDRGDVGIAPYVWEGRGIVPCGRRNAEDHSVFENCWQKKEVHLQIKTIWQIAVHIDALDQKTEIRKGHAYECRKTDKPFRKQMRLKGYDYLQAGYYFVTICTLHRCERWDAS